LSEEWIWLTWETQRRNRTTSEALGARLIELDYAHHGLRRYVRAVGRTVAILRRLRPRLIFAQNPSIVLAALVTEYGNRTGTPVIIDAHNAGVHPFDGRRPWANTLNRRILRSASLTIVTNNALAEFVANQGGRPFILPDPIPMLPPPKHARAMQGEFNVLFICTWASDEPYAAVLAAAGTLPPGFRIYITGASKGREHAFGPLPENVSITGFVHEDEFVELLHGADLVMDLTTRENCLVCGAYEALAAEKPLLLSDTRALRAYFNAGAVYTDNTATDIASKLVLARDQCASLRTEAIRLKAELCKSWRARRHALLEELAAILNEQRGVH
jgi:glycosyltransferase involved in cell wall biosynthesis